MAGGLKWEAPLPACPRRHALAHNRKHASKQACPPPAAASTRTPRCPSTRLAPWRSRAPSLRPTLPPASSSGCSRRGGGLGCAGGECMVRVRMCSSPSAPPPAPPPLCPPIQESELTPTGSNLLDGRYAVFGYVTEGASMLKDMQVRGCVFVCGGVGRGQGCCRPWPPHSPVPPPNPPSPESPGGRQDRVCQGGERRGEPGAAQVVGGLGRSAFWQACALPMRSLEFWCPPPLALRYLVCLREPRA